MAADPVYRAAYEALEEEFALGALMFRRARAALSQAEVAKRMEQRSLCVLGGVSRGMPPHSLEPLCPQAVGHRLCITLEPRSRR